MKVQIEQLAAGYTLEVVSDSSEAKISAFQSLQGMLLTLIEMCAINDPRAKTVAITQKYEARFRCILEVLKTSGEAMTVNQVAIRTADLMGKEYSAHFQRGVGVALANAIARPSSQVERVGYIGSGVYRYRSEEVK